MNNDDERDYAEESYNASEYRREYESEETDTKHAWIITTDHLYETSDDQQTATNEAGISGPHNAPARLLNGLGDPMSDIYRKADVFHIYDDDGVIYYTGRLATIDDTPDEDAQMAPLYDFGGPNASAVLIKYENHPEWTIEY